MKLKRFVLVIVVFLLLSAPASMLFAQTTYYDSTTLTTDMGSLVSGLSDLFGQSLGGMSYVGDAVGYAFISHFAIGAGGGALLIPVENLSFVSSGLDVDWGKLAYIPIPTASAFMKFSIKRLEFGFKLGGFPNYSTNAVTVHNMVLGGKVRYKLTGFNLFIIKGGISVGGLFEYMNGGLSISQSQGFPIYQDVPEVGNVLVGNVDTTAKIDNSWKASTFGGEAQANFQLLFLNFFVGSRVSKTLGSAKSEFSGTVDLTAEPGYSEYVIPATQLLSDSATTKAPGVDIFGFGGVEFKLLFLTITGRGSYNFHGKTLAADVGARLQF